MTQPEPPQRSTGPAMAANSAPPAGGSPRRSSRLKPAAAKARLPIPWPVAVGLVVFALAWVAVAAWRVRAANAGSDRSVLAERESALAKACSRYSILADRVLSNELAQKALPTATTPQELVRLWQHVRFLRQALAECRDYFAEVARCRKKLDGAGPLDEAIRANADALMGQAEKKSAQLDLAQTIVDASEKAIDEQHAAFRAAGEWPEGLIFQ